jgi:hypothetical protein
MAAHQPIIPPSLQAVKHRRQQEQTGNNDQRQPSSLEELQGQFCSQALEFETNLPKSRSKVKSPAVAKFSWKTELFLVSFKRLAYCKHNHFVARALDRAKFACTDARSDFQRLRMPL